MPTDAQRRNLASAHHAEVLALNERIAGLEANEKVLLAQIQGHTQWREKIIKSSEQAYGESAIRYKFSLTKNGKCMNTFPKSIDGRWFALVPAENDGHIGHIARVALLEQQLAEAKRQMESQKDEWLAWEAKRAALELDAKRYRKLRAQVYVDPAQRILRISGILLVGSGPVLHLLDDAIDAAITRTQEQT